jgi:hypothetical protein
MSENHLHDTETDRELGVDPAAASPGARLWVAAWSGGRAVRVRGLSREGPEREMVGTSEMTLDLQAPIDNLRSITSDLEAYYWERSDDGDRHGCERYQIGLWIRQINERTAVLLEILMHMRSRAVVVTGISPAEREALESAATLLDRWIREDEPFHDVMGHVTAILNAADRIALRAAGGRPED